MERRPVGKVLGTKGLLEGRQREKKMLFPLVLLLNFDFCSLLFFARLRRAKQIAKIIPCFLEIVRSCRAIV